MEKKFTILLIIMVVISLYYNYKLSRSAEPSAASFVAGNGPTFEQKQKCAVYKRDIEAKFEKNNSESTTIFFNYFDRIFYSPKQNSCLYIYTGSIERDASSMSQASYLVDALTGETLVRTNTMSHGVIDSEAQSRFDELVKNYEI